MTADLRRLVKKLWRSLNTLVDISAYVRSYLCFFYLNEVIFAVSDVSSLPLQKS